MICNIAALTLVPDSHGATPCYICLNGTDISDKREKRPYIAICITDNAQTNTK